MKLVTFSHQGTARLGALAAIDGQPLVLDLARAQPDLPTDMLAFLAGGEPAWALARAALAHPDRAWLLAQPDVTLLAPVPRPGKIICLGHNYHDHRGSASAELPEFPTFFAKFPNTVIGPGQPILIPRASNMVDYEAEFAVVIGTRARHVPQVHALDYVAGYTILNDVSARDYVRRTTQWTLGKSFDTFCPMGPALVTADEIPDPAALTLSLAVNGEERQHASTGDLIFSIPFLIAYLAEVMTLEPGDVIATGTPSGTGASRKPPVFLKPGDVIRVCIDRLGELVTPVAAEQ